MEEKTEQKIIETQTKKNNSLIKRLFIALLSVVLAVLTVVVVNL